MDEGTIEYGAGSVTGTWYAKHDPGASLGRAHPVKYGSRGCSSVALSLIFLLRGRYVDAISFGGCTAKVLLLAFTKAS